MKTLIIIIIIILLIGVSSYFLFFKKQKETSQPEESKNMPNLSHKKIAMIIAFKNFKDEEYFTPREIFENAGAEIKVVSNKLGTAVGVDGGEVGIDIQLSELDVSGFDAIVFIGGPGALENLDGSDAYRIAKDTVSKNKLLAAICISPTILAKSGVLQGKKATVWTSPLDKQAKKVLEENGVQYQDKDVVIDGNIITANGPEAAKDFGRKVIEFLSK